MSVMLYVVCCSVNVSVCVVCLTVFVNCLVKQFAMCLGVVAILFIRLAGFAIMTFDFPIWLKAVNIIKQANLPIIARLGGFHLLQSYLGSMGNIMQNSGQLDVIQLIYPGSTTSNHIIDG